MKNILIILLIPLLVACASHRHQRPITNDNGELVGLETTKWSFFAIDSQAAQVAVTVKDDDYQRSVEASDASVLTDEETIQRISEGISQGVGAALSNAFR